MDIKYESTLPKEDDFYELYETTGWNGRVGVYSPKELFRAISNSWYVVTVYYEQKLIGFGRIISDGIYQTFITDIIIHPDFQRKGIGRNVMNLLVEKCKLSGIQWIQLSAAKGKKEFYEKLGFKERDLDAPGMQILINASK